MTSALAPDVEAQISADEALARRLQAEQQRVDSSTPLISAFWPGYRNSSGAMSVNEIGDSRAGGAERDGDRAQIDQVENREIVEVQGGAGVTGGGGGVSEDPGARRNVRINVMDDGVRGMNASRFGLLLLMLVNVPLILAGVFVLALHWGDKSDCDSSYRRKWRWWALVSVVRMMLITPVVAVRWKLEGQRESERNTAVDQLSNNMRNSLDIVGLVWFVIGNMWLLQVPTPCSTGSPIYQLCLVYIIITYIHICLPCILLMLLVPVICFCLPCVIRVLGMLQGPQRRKGARQEEIAKLPILKYSDMEHAEDESCAICLADYVDSDELRQLPCSHAFHKSCVDSWLAVNASCPNCRARCFDLPADEGEEKTSENNAPVAQELA